MAIVIGKKVCFKCSLNSDVHTHTHTFNTFNKKTSRSQNVHSHVHLLYHELFNLTNRILMNVKFLILFLNTSLLCLSIHFLLSIIYIFKHSSAVKNGHCFSSLGVLYALCASPLFFCLFKCFISKPPR